MQNLAIIIISVAIVIWLGQMNIKRLAIQSLFGIVEKNWYRFLMKPMMLALPRFC